MLLLAIAAEEPSEAVDAGGGDSVTADFGEDDPGSLVETDDRIQRVDKPDHFESYRPNYILFGDNEDQVLFQFSFRFNIWPTDDPLQVFLGYTQRSWWRLYDAENSSPFTENNYSPELFFRYRFETAVLGEGFDQIQFGYQHESNGEDSVRSRSWDRLYVEQRYVKYFGAPSMDVPTLRAYLRLWVIVAEDPFNRDLEDFAGPGELIVDLSSGRTAAGRFEAEVLARKGGYNFRFDERTLQLGLRWIPPWSDWVQFTPGLYVQSFFGTLQSLERYNIGDNAVRFGIYFAGG